MELNNLNVKEIKKLVSLVEEANVSHLSIEHEGTKIEIKKELAPSHERIIAPINTLPHSQPTPSETIYATPEKTAPNSTEDTSNYKEIKAQMVGTMYTSADPESPPFVKVGDTIKKGQVICIIEAMKLFNEIESEHDGEIVEICVKNGEAVEFGQTLFKLS